MGCTCGCHDRMSALAIRGCCWECEAAHDPLRNALDQLAAANLRIDELKAVLVREIHGTPCNGDDSHRHGYYHCIKCDDLARKAFGGRIEASEKPAERWTAEEIKTLYTEAGKLANSFGFPAPAPPPPVPEHQARRAPCLCGPEVIRKHGHQISCTGWKA